MEDPRSHPTEERCHRWACYFYIQPTFLHGQVPLFDYVCSNVCVVEIDESCQNGCNIANVLINLKCDCKLLDYKC